MTSVTFAYKTNPAKYESNDAGITLAVPKGMSPATAMKAARAIVYTTLGMETDKPDRSAAKEYLAKVFPGTVLADFKTQKD